MKVSKRVRIKLLIAISKTVEEADEVISQNYNFETVKEKIAFLKGMFDVEVIDVHDADGTSKEESDKMTYFTMLNVIINSYI